MTSRRATDEEVRSWQTEGWVLLEGIVDADEIDAARADLHRLYPTNEEFHADPEGETERRRGHPVLAEEEFVWPENGPGFRSAQGLWSDPFPFPGSGVLNRLCVHPAIVDFAERALESPDIRLYQIHATVKYEGVTNYEQPMHTDRNHSFLPAIPEAPWRNLEGFLYLTDVTEDDNPTAVVPTSLTKDIPDHRFVVMPDTAPELYRAERPAVGPRGSYFAYRSDVFHRGTAFATPGTSRAVLALAFRRAGHDWIGYDQVQSRANEPEWTRFAEQCSPRELELFGFPPPGHAIWTEGLLAATRRRYPLLDLEPWQRALDP